MDKVADLKKSLELVLAVDPTAGYEFEDCGSGTCVLNIHISDEAVAGMTEEKVNELEKVGICPNDEGETPQELVQFEDGHQGFFILLS